MKTTWTPEEFQLARYGYAYLKDQKQVRGHLKQVVKDLTKYERSEITFDRPAFYTHGDMSDAHYQYDVDDDYTRRAEEGRFY